MSHHTNNRLSWSWVRSQTHLCICFFFSFSHLVGLKENSGQSCIPAWMLRCGSWFVVRGPLHRWSSEAIWGVDQDTLSGLCFFSLIPVPFQSFCFASLIPFDTSRKNIWEKKTCNWKLQYNLRKDSVSQKMIRTKNAIFFSSEFELNHFFFLNEGY